MRHGFREVGEPMVVTRSRKGRIYTLDHKPALHAYLRVTAPFAGVVTKRLRILFEMESSKKRNRK